MPYELAPWLDQPPATTPLNLTGPLARGLALYAPVVQQIGGRAADVKRFADGTFSGATANRSSKLGRSVALDGSASTWLDFGSDARLKSPDLTWTGSFVLKSLSNAYSAVFSYVSGGEYYQLLLKSNGQLAVYVKQAAGTAVFYDGTGAFTLETGRKYRLGFSVSATSGVARAFVNGRLDGTTSGGVIAGGFNGSAVSVYLGNDSGTPGRLLSADVGNIALHLRELTALEHRSFAEREWQLFAPRRIFVPVAAAGGGGATGTLATTNAADTSAASGTTTLRGTLARTNASDTLSAAGKTTILGTLARTNADDTAVASGSVGSASGGTSATTNANDTSAGSGTTTVRGTAATTNAADTASGAGTTTLRGTSATTNNADTAAASGVAGAITGTSNTVNADDTAQAGTPNTSDAGGGGSDTRRRTASRRPKFTLDRAGKVFFFDTLEDKLEAKRAAEIAVLMAMEDKPKAAKAAKPVKAADVAVPVLAQLAAEVVDVQDLRQFAQAVGQADEFRRAAQSRHYQELLQMFYVMQQADEDDVETLLMAVM